MVPVRRVCHCLPLVLVLLLAILFLTCSPTAAAKSTKKKVPRVNPLEGLSDKERRSAKFALDHDSLTDEIESILLQGDHILENNKDYQTSYDKYLLAERLYRRLPGFIEPYIHTEILTRVGRLLSLSGRDCQAIQWLEQAVALLPNDAMIHFSYAITLTNCHRDRESIASYERALEIGVPRAQLAPTMYMLGRSLHKLGRWSRALHFLRKVKTLDPNFQDIDLTIGHALERSGKLEESLKYYNTTIRMSPTTDTRGQQRLGSVLIRLGRLDEGRKYLKVHVSQTPELEPFYNKEPFNIPTNFIGHAEPWSIKTSRGESDKDGEGDGNGEGGDILSPNEKSEYLVQPLWPLDSERLSQQSNGSYVGPTIFSINNFLSSEECSTIRNLFDELHHVSRPSPLTCFARTKKLDDLITSGRLPTTTTLTDGASESQECLNATSTVLDTLSYSTSSFIYHSQHTFIDMVHMRLERVLGLKHLHGASSQILRYIKDEEYTKHMDCATDTRTNDRSVTVLIYLTNVLSGGETIFTRLPNVTIKPELGKLIVFTSLDREGYCDPLSEHASKKVGEGEKYVLQKWYHSVPPSSSAISGLFKHTHHPRQSVINCDFTDSCREYIRYDPKLIRKTKVKKMNTETTTTTTTTNTVTTQATKDEL